MIYENLKLRIQRYKENKIITDSAGKSKSTKVEVKPFETFVAAAIAKCVAIVATYPHEVVRIRLRESANGAAYKYTGFVSALKIIAKEEGVRGLYGGKYPFPCFSSFSISLFLFDSWPFCILYISMFKFVCINEWYFFLDAHDDLGMGIHLARSVPNAAIMFLAFEISSKWLIDGSTGSK